MKGKKEHDSDEEVDVTAEEIIKPSKPKDNPISPPSQTAEHRHVHPQDIQTIRYSYMEDPEEGVLFEEQSMEIK